MEKILEALKAPFEASQIHWRVGATSKDKKKGIALAYIDARDVMKRLDDVVGFQNWSDSYDETRQGRILCTLELRLETSEKNKWQDWVSKTDGAGETQVEGEKGAISDAFKRAAVKWGIGRYLYYLPNQWCELDNYKKIVKPPTLPKWALPS